MWMRSNLDPFKPVWGWDISCKYSRNEMCQSSKWYLLMGLVKCIYNNDSSMDCTIKLRHIITTANTTTWQWGRESSVLPLPGMSHPIRSYFTIIYCNKIGSFTEHLHSQVAHLLDAMRLSLLHCHFVQCAARLVQCAAFNVRRCTHYGVGCIDFMPEANIHSHTLTQHTPAKNNIIIQIQ